MTPHTMPQTVLFPDLFDKPLVATFNQEHASSDGGAVLLKAAERVYGLVKAFARCLADKRDVRGSDRPADLRHRVRSSRWQRCRPLGRRPHPQAAARAGPGVRRALGVATYDLAVRERRDPHRALPDGARVGGVRHRAASAPPARAGAARHHRSGSDRRPDARRPAAHVLQRALWRLVLSAAARVSELRPRGGAVSVRGGGTLGLLCRLLPLLRAAFPRARFLVRLDGGFDPGGLEFLDAEPRLDYVVARPNPRCRRRARRARSVARPHTSIPTPATPPAPGAMSAGW